jgi:hypothetical protein
MLLRFPSGQLTLAQAFGFLRAGHDLDPVPVASSQQAPEQGRHPACWPLDLLDPSLLLLLSWSKNGLPRATGIALWHCGQSMSCPSTDDPHLLWSHRSHRSWTSHLGLFSCDWNTWEAANVRGCDWPHRHHRSMLQPVLQISVAIQ